ncbi:MAG: FkbM family methyltransferase [Bacteroidales bacterium]|nr:FkbM family methyltransferase [Bacteroidales bacterium]
MITRFKDKFSEILLNYHSGKRKKSIAKEIDPEFVAHFNIDVECKPAWYGTSYGGFYVLPELLNENSIIYSIGVGKDISFDKACIKKHNCKVFAFDPTPKSIEWIKRQKLPVNFRFFPFGISSADTGYFEFYLPKHEKGVSGSLVLQNDVAKDKPISVLMKSFSDITNELDHRHIDVLKMDIEGAEYVALKHVLNSPVIVDQLIIEFHDRSFEQTTPKSRNIVKQLLDSGYHIFGCSISFEEISFVHHRKFKALGL